MSRNQPRAVRSESFQYQKTGRSGSSNQQGNFPAVSTKGGGGAASTPSNPGSRSFKKNNNGSGQGGQSRARSPNGDSEFAANAVQNGPHQQQPTQRVSDVPMTSTSSNAKVTGAPSQKINSDVPKAQLSNVSATPPITNVSAANSGSGLPTTPSKGDASKSFPLQFGSISPGFMNGVQVPPRTSSAPPNLDEQKRDQIPRESFRAAPCMPVPPSVPKQQIPKKEDQNNAGEAPSLPFAPPVPKLKMKRDLPQVSPAPPPTQTQKPAVHPISNMHMQIPFHHSQIPVQFNGPVPQIQSQPISSTSLPLPMQMPLSIGNPSMQQPMFISGLHPHQMQSQGMMHQPHNYNFSPQLSPHHINMGPQFPQQQAGKFSSVPRKTVKITNPHTNEELRLGGSHPNVQPQSQAVTSFPPNYPMNYYPNSYNTTSAVFPTASSVPVNSYLAPPASQPPRITKQVTVRPPVVSHVEKEPLPAKSSISVGEAESKDPSRLLVDNSARPVKEIEPSPLSSSTQSKLNLGTPTSSAHEPRNTVVVINDKPKESVNIDCQDQVGRQTISLSSLPSPLSEAEAVTTKSGLSVTDLVPETAKESTPKTLGASSVTTSSFTNEGAAEIKKDDASESLSTKDVNSGQSEPEIISECLKSDKHSLETSLNTLSLESPEVSVKFEETFDQEVIANISGSVDTTRSTKTECGENTEVPVSVNGISAQDDRTCTKSYEVINEESVPVSVPENGAEDNNVVPVSPSSPTVKDKVLSDLNAAKSAMPRGKKKKELYRKAEAAGTSSDLYNAYKGPEEEKKESVKSSDSTGTNIIISIKPTSPEVTHENDLLHTNLAPSKAEPDNWEDAAENSPQLETTKNENQKNDRDGNGLLMKKYSRDFLLKFVDQCSDLPDGFEISSDLSDVMMVSGNISRESHASPGRNTDRPSSRSDRRTTGLVDEDKWNKSPGPIMTGRGDIWMDMGHAGNVGLRPGQGGNLKNPRPQTPIHYGGGVLSGPMQFLGPQGGGIQRNNSDSDRWQRGTGFMKGFMPSPIPVMHKAERKYEVGKVTDEEQAKQRQLKGILNKLTPQNFEKLFQQVKEVNIDNVITLSGVISQIFDKALMEPTFCEMYADFCFHLAAGLPELSVDNQKITFKRLLLNKCQEEFERGEREEEEANKAEEEGVCKQTVEEREEKRIRVRRRMLGNIRLIGELYKKRMLTERIMHECMNKLLGQYQNPDEENIEALCKLMSTIGEMIDHPKAKDHMDAYFDIMTQLSNNMRLSSRVRFMLKDSIDLRRNHWQQRRKVEGPKKIEEVHRDAAQERHAQTSRLARVPSMGISTRRVPMEFAPRAPVSMISSPASHIGGGPRGAPLQMRGYGFSQDARSDDRHIYENRTLPQRPLGDDNITLGPQGGLVRGIGFRGRQSTAHLAEISAHGNANRVEYPAMPERAGYNVQREDFTPSYNPDNRYVVGSNYDAHREVRNTDRGFERPPSEGGPPSSMLDVSSDNKVCLDDHGFDRPPSEGGPPSSVLDEHLRVASLAAIKEFYSARDENEVALCIKDLNTPSFYPCMISIWIIDSFEMKDKERDLLTNLLINLTKPQDDDAIITEDQLVKGFESALAELESALSDAPRAPEFLGHTFASVILENIISLSEIGRLIYQGGEKQGSLVEIGLADEVLGSILETIKSEKGDIVLNDICSTSNLRLENFRRPPGSKKPSKLDKFM